MNEVIDEIEKLQIASFTEIVYDSKNKMSKLKFNK